MEQHPPSTPRPKEFNEQTRTAVAPAHYPETTPRPCMALVAGSGGSHTSSELNCLLRRRLRIACTIALVGGAAFLVKNFIYHPEFGPQ